MTDTQFASIRANVVAAEEIRGEHSGGYLRLARLWERRSHHSWVMAAVNAEPYRDGLIARLNALKMGSQIELNPADGPLHWLASLQKADASGASRLHVVFRQGWLPGAVWWREANTLRERLADAFAHLVILWLPDSVISEIAHAAPDLWNWREAVFDFSLREPANTNPLPSRAFSGITQQDKTQVTERLAEIDSYFARHDPTQPAAAHLLLEGALAHERLGNLSLSMKWAERAVVAFDLQNNGSLAAQAKGKIADILQARGQLDEALKIRQNDELPVYEQLGDIRSAAITKGKIADILQARGQLDETLKIRQNDQLPVYEQLGDIRSAAITKGQIADILEARGQLDEALKIWVEQVLPVFDAVGYKNEAAWARKRISALELQLQRQAKRGKR